MWASMDILVYMSILCEQLCVCACISYAHLNVLKCVGQGKCCTRAHADTHTLIRFRKWCRPLSEGMGECVLSTAAINY